MHQDIFSFESTIELRKSLEEGDSNRLHIKPSCVRKSTGSLEKERERNWRRRRRNFGVYFRRKIMIARWLSRRGEDRPRGYLLLRPVYATGYYSTPTTCLFLLPTPSTFIRRLFLPLHPANTRSSPSPNPTNCGVAYLYLVSASLSVSCRLVSHEWSGSVDAVPIALSTLRCAAAEKATRYRSRNDTESFSFNFFFFFFFFLFVSQIIAKVKVCSKGVFRFKVFLFFLF